MEFVNPVDPAELEAWTSTLLTTFLHTADAKERARSATMWRHRLQPERTWGVRDHGLWVATLATDARTLTVPAATGTSTLDIDALTAVTVNATHRRRGVLTRLITSSLTAAHERGDAVSYLVAAEWPIYGRFGYGPATRFADYTLHSRAPGAALGPAAGAVRQVEPAEYAELGPGVFAAARPGRAGEISRNPRYWTAVLDDEPRGGWSNLLVHEGADGPDGLLSWQPKRDFELGNGYGAVEVTDLVAATDDAYRGLWGYLLGLDVVDEVRLPGRAVDEPVRHLLADGRTLQETFAGDFTWVRVLDVPAALTARGYRAAGALVLEVLDPAGFAGGRWLLDASPDGVSCESTTRSADLTITARALGSAYLGDYPLALTRGAEEHTAGAVARFDLLFGTTLLPYCSSGF